MQRSHRFLLLSFCAAVVVLCAGIATWALWSPPPDADDLTGYAARGDIAGVQYCLRRGVDPNAPSHWGWNHENLGQTPLTAAAQFGRVDVVLLLLRNGADPNLRDFGSEFPHETPLSTAAMHGQVEVCRVLLEAGADPNVPTNPNVAGDPGNWTALDYALHDEQQPAIVDLLQQHGAVEGRRRHGR